MLLTVLRYYRHKQPSHDVIYVPPASITYLVGEQNEIVEASTTHLLDSPISNNDVFVQAEDVSVLTLSDGLELIQIRNDEVSVLWTA